MKHDAPPYAKIASHEAKNGEFGTCLLLYSGGLDTSVMLKWIQEKYHANVITLTVDIGQTVDDLEAIAAKAKALGAIETLTVDARDRFADKLLSLAIKANADYQGGYALCTPLGRIIISQLAVEYAEKYNCSVIAHGATGKGNDQVRFETYITTLNPQLKILAPLCWSLLIKNWSNWSRPEPKTNSKLKWTKNGHTSPMPHSGLSQRFATSTPTSTAKTAK